MSVRLANLDDCERSGNWQLVRRTFGVKLVDIPSGEQIPEHDETERDQEEVFSVVSGSPMLVIDAEDHPARAGTFAGLDPQHRRTVPDEVDELARVLIASPPRSSGYLRMEWV